MVAIVTLVPPPQKCGYCAHMARRARIGYAGYPVVKHHLEKMSKRVKLLSNSKQNSVRFLPYISPLGYEPGLCRRDVGGGRSSGGRIICSKK